MILIPVVIVAATFGYLIGVRGAHVSSAASPVQSTRIAAGANVLLEYPSSWQPVTAAPAIPGLAFTRSLVLAPHGDSAQAGLLSGQLPAGQAGPLPAQFVAFDNGLPRAEVVAFANTQAYRYSQFHLDGYSRALELYVIPNAGEDITAMGCYAASEASSYMRQCEQIITQLTLSGQQRYDLRPNAAYADQLSSLIGDLDTERLALRGRMRLRSTPTTIGTLAAALAQRFAVAAAALRQLEPPLAASLAQTALASSIQSAHDAYQALAWASDHGPAEYDSARRQVGDAEAGVDVALESYALLGYNST